MIRARSTVVGLASAALVALASPASAGTWHAADARHDVATFSHSAEPAPCGTDSDGTDPTDALRDITGLRVDHSTEAVTIRLVMGEVRRRDHDTSWTLHLRVPAGAFYVSVGRAARGGKLLTFLAKEPRIPAPDECGSSLSVSTGRSCTGLRAAVDPRRDTLEVTLPRECVEEPRWVQVGAQVNGGFSGTPEDYTVHSDEWAGPGEETSGFLPPYGPRVQRR